MNIITVRNSIVAALFLAAAPAAAEHPRVTADADSIAQALAGSGYEMVSEFQHFPDPVIYRHIGSGHRFSIEPAECRLNIGDDDVPSGTCRTINLRVSFEPAQPTASDRALRWWARRHRLKLCLAETPFEAPLVTVGFSLRAGSKGVTRRQLLAHLSRWTVALTELDRALGYRPTPIERPGAGSKAICR